MVVPLLGASSAKKGPLLVSGGGPLVVLLVVPWLSRGCPVARGEFSKKGSAVGVARLPGGCPAGFPVDVL